MVPRAGRCRECDAWVWVDENGCCQFGHAAASVEDVHDQPDPSEPNPEKAASSAKHVPPEDQFGRGEMPQYLRRFNWGAFFLPFFWGFAYRSWPVLMAWFIAVMGPLLVFSMAGAVGENVPLDALLTATVISEVVTGLCRLWAGSNANAGLWRRDMVLLDLVPGYQSRISVQKFVRRQKTWAIVGAVFVPFTALVLVPLEAKVWSEYGLTYVGAALPMVWLVAEIGLGLWLDARLRKDPPDLEHTAQNLG